MQFSPDDKLYIAGWAHDDTFGLYRLDGSNLTRTVDLPGYPRGLATVSPSIFFVTKNISGADNSELYLADVRTGTTTRVASGLWDPLDIEYDPSLSRLYWRGQDWRTVMAIQTPIPEPSTFALLILAAVGLLAYGWRRKIAGG